MTADAEFFSADLRRRTKIWRIRQLAAAEGSIAGAVMAGAAAVGAVGVQEKYEWWWMYMCDAKRKQLLAGPMQICTLGDRDEVLACICYS